MNERELFLVLFTLPGIRSALIWRILKVNEREGRNLKEFFRLPERVYQGEYHLPGPIANFLNRNRKRVFRKGKEEIARLQEWGINTITVLDEGYPSGLREYFEYPPPVLCLHGNPEILTSPKVAFLNSRTVDRRGLEVTNALADLAAEMGLTIVASSTKPSYNLPALRSKIRHSPLLLVSDRGIFQAFAGKKEREPSPLARRLGELFDPKNTLVLSPFAPEDVGTPGSGAQRDRLILALSDLILAVQIRPEGNMERECLQAHRRGKRVRICQFPPSTSPADGNLRLIQAGLTPLTVDELLLEYQQLLANMVQTPLPGVAVPTMMDMPPTEKKADREREILGLLKKLTGKAFPSGAKMLNLFCGTGQGLHLAGEIFHIPDENLFGIEPRPGFREGWVYSGRQKRFNLLISDPLLNLLEWGVEPHQFHLVWGIPSTDTKKNHIQNWAQLLAQPESLHPHSSPAYSPALQAFYGLPPYEIRRAAFAVNNLFRNYEIWKRVEEKKPVSLAEFLPGFQTMEKKKRRVDYRKIFDLVEHYDWTRQEPLDEEITPEVLERLSACPPELYYLERFIQLARPDGWIAIALSPSTAQTLESAPLSLWLSTKVHTLYRYPLRESELTLFIARKI